jgi:hypothetical protein
VPSKSWQKKEVLNAEWKKTASIRETTWCLRRQQRRPPPSCSCNRPQ